LHIGKEQKGQTIASYGKRLIKWHVIEKPEDMLKCPVVLDF